MSTDDTDERGASDTDAPEHPREHAETDDPDALEWTPDALRPRFPAAGRLPESAPKILINTFRNPHASGAFIAEAVNLVRDPDDIATCIKALMAAEEPERAACDAANPTQPHYGTGTEPVNDDRRTFADLSPLQRGAIDVAARDLEVQNAIDDPDQSLPTDDIARRASARGFTAPSDGYPEELFKEYRDVIRLRAAVLEIRQGGSGRPVRHLVDEVVQDAMDPDTDLRVADLLAAAGYVLPDHNLDGIPAAEDVTGEDLYQTPDYDSATDRAVTPRQAAVAGRPLPVDPDATAAADPRVPVDTATMREPRHGNASTKADEDALPDTFRNVGIVDEEEEELVDVAHADAIPDPWPGIRSVLARQDTTNRSVYAGVPYVAVINGTRAWRLYLNLDAGMFSVNGMIGRATLAKGIQTDDFDPGDRVVVYLRERKNLEAENDQDVELEFILAPRTVAAMVSPAVAEQYAAEHEDLLPGVGASEQTPSVVPDPNTDSLTTDPDVYPLSEAVAAVPEDERDTIAGQHPSEQYDDRAEGDRDELLSLSRAWEEGESINPQPFEDAPGDKGVPDAVRYHPEPNVVIIKRDSTIQTVLSARKLGEDRYEAVRATGYDPTAPNPTATREDLAAEPSYPDGNAEDDVTTAGTNADEHSIADDDETRHTTTALETVPDDHPPSDAAADLTEGQSDEGDPKSADVGEDENDETETSTSDTASAQSPGELTAAPTETGDSEGEADTGDTSPNQTDETGSDPNPQEPGTGDVQAENQPFVSFPRIEAELDSLRERDFTVTDVTIDATRFPTTDGSEQEEVEVTFTCVK